MAKADRIRPVCRTERKRREAINQFGRLVLAIILLLAISPAYADTVVSGVYNVNATQGYKLTNGGPVVSIFANTTTGNVGIGTTSPTRTLQINSTGGISLETNESAYFAAISGNVGIGTTSPQQKLHVIGNATISTTLNINGGRNTDNTGNITFGIGMDATKKAGLLVTDNFAVSSADQGAFLSSVVYGSNYAGYNPIYASVYGNAFDVNPQNGNGWSIESYVSNSAGANRSGGIQSKIGTVNLVDTGTTVGFHSMNYLQNANLTTYEGFVSLGQNAVAPIVLTNQYDFYAQQFLSSSQGHITNRYGLYIDFDNTNITNPYGIYQTSNTVNNYFNGNIGIGTTAPTHKLQINGSGGVSLETNESAYLAVGGGNVGIGTANPSAKLEINGANIANNLSLNVNNTLYVNASGNVGIGTASPNYKLDVSGTINAHSFLINGTSVNGNVTGSGTTGYIPQWQSNSLLNNSIIYQNGTNIGIGTTSPGNKLDVIGNISIKYDSFTTPTTAFLQHLDSSNNVLFALKRMGAGSNSLEIRGYNEIGFAPNNADTLAMNIMASGNVGIGTSSPAALLEINGTNIANNLSLNVNNTLYVNASGKSNVGIGTTSPAYKLDVNGTVNAASFLINGTSVGNGNVTGSGTAGYIPQWQSDSILNNSIIYQNGANIGIGTTNPSAKLEVSGTNPANNLSLNVKNILYVNNSGFVGIGTSSPDSRLSISYAGSNVLSIENLGTGGGKVGIGPGDSGYNPGTFFFNNDGTGTLTAIGIEPGGNTTFNTGGSVGINTATPASTLHVNSSTGAGALRVENTTGSSLLFVNGTSGNVGIGTTSPGYLLHVYGASPTATVEATNAGSGGAASLVLLGGRNYAVQSLGNAGGLQIHDSSGNTNPFKIDSAGNVGIWTTAPTRRLQVNGTGGVSLETNESAYFAVTSGSVGIGTSSPLSKLDVNGGVAIGTYAGVNATPSNGLIVSGSVGIGTAGPLNTLDVQSAANATFRLVSINKVPGTRTSMFIGDGISNNGVDIGTELVFDDSTNTFVINNSGDPNSRISFATRLGGVISEKMKIDENGNVGIGTISPAALLHLNSSLGAGALRVENTTGSSLFFVNGTSGNIGIGNSTPNKKLVVVGSTGGITTIDSANSVGQILGYDYTGAPAWLISDNSTHLAVGTSNSHPLQLQANGVPAVTIMPSGTVGINTTNPTSTLHVVGDINVTGNSYLNNLNIAGVTLANGNVNISSSLIVTGNITTINGSVWQPVYGSDDNLTLYLPFSEGGGTTTYDKGPYGNDGILGNGTASTIPLWASGKYGNAIDFDGIDDVVNVTLANSFSSPTGSIEMWIKSKGSTGSTQVFLGSAQNVSLEGTATAMNFYINGTCALSVSYNQGEWTHFVGAWNGAINILYKNGAQVASGTCINNVTGGTLFTIGGNISSAPGNATIDEVRLYKRVLQADEIRTQYLRGLQSEGYVRANAFKIINTTNNELLRVTNTGNVGIGTITPTQKLSVVGNANVTGNIYYGGNLTGYGADFAEMMQPAESVEAGDVVCMNDNMAVVKCNVHGQSSVAGVVSNNPTITGHAKNGGVAVGIVGIVKTKVTGKVSRYDMLTTSSKAGYAEKATSQDFGAIIGKAMESCNSECVINVLVGLR